MKKIRIQKIIKPTLLLARKKGVMHAINYLLSETSNTLELKHAYGHPTFARIESTSKCNSKCIMCWRVENQKKTRHMLFSEFKSIILKLPYCNTVSLQGNLGEPLLNPDILRMIKFCKERKIHVWFITNASLLSEDMSRELILSGVSYTGFSVDSANEKTFNQIRKGLNLTDIKKNIKRFVELKNELGSKTPTTEIWTVVSDRNIHQIKELLNLAKSLGVTNVLLKDLAENSYHPLRRISQERLDILLKYKTYGKSIGVDVKLFFPDLPPFSNRKRIECHHPWNSIFITVNGWVVPCCCFPIEEYQNSNAGNILQQDFDSIWNGKFYKKIRAKVSKEGLDPYCIKCPWSG